MSPPTPPPFGQPPSPYAPPGAYPPGPPGPPLVDSGLEYIVPINVRNGWAFAAGYLGLFSLLLGPITGVPAIVLGVIGLRKRELGNAGRAWTGVILGGLMTFLFLVWLLFALTRK